MRYVTEIHKTIYRKKSDIFLLAFLFTTRARNFGVYNRRKKDIQNFVFSFLFIVKVANTIWNSNNCEVSCCNAIESVQLEKWTLSIELGHPDMGENIYVQLKQMTKLICYKHKKGNFSHTQTQTLKEKLSEKTCSYQKWMNNLIHYMHKSNKNFNLSIGKKIIKTIYEYI
jgi:hypothetical protein